MSKIAWYIKNINKIKAYICRFLALFKNIFTDIILYKFYYCQWTKDVFGTQWCVGKFSTLYWFTFKAAIVLYLKLTIECGFIKFIVTKPIFISKLNKILLFSWFHYLTFYFTYKFVFQLIFTLSASSARN